MTWSFSEEHREHQPDKPYCSRLPSCSQRLWPKFDAYLRERDLDYGLARENCWFPSRTVDGFDRMVVPGTSDQDGNLYYQARLIGDAPMGTNPRRWESPHGIARGNSLCLVWPRVLRPGRHAAVVEGPMDALAAAGEGFLGLGLMGVHPADEVLYLTRKLLRGTIPLLIMDLNAEKEWMVVQARLREMGCPGRLVSPYPGKDLAKLGREARRKVLGIE